jgi:hypothetical protein
VGVKKPCVDGEDNEPGWRKVGQKRRSHQIAMLKGMGKGKGWSIEKVISDGMPMGP